MSEKAFIGIPFFIGSTAYFLDDGKVVAAGLYGKSFIVNNKRLIVVNKLFGQLTEGNVFGVEFLLNELRQGSSGVEIGGVCSFCPVYPYTFTEFLADDVRHCQQGHLCFETSLKQILDLFCIKIHLAFHQGVKCCMDGKQQLVQFGIDLYGFIAFAVQSTFTRIP